MIELYDHPISPAAQKVHLVLAEKEIEFESHFVDLASKQNLTPEYLKINPAGQVPTLVLDGRSFPESTVICELLDDLFPDPPLRSQNPLELAQMRLWTKRLDETLHAACGGLQWPMLMLPVLEKMSSEDAEALLAKVPDPVRRGRQQELYRLGMRAPVAVTAINTYRQFLVDMEAVLQQQTWLAGSSYSLADLGVTPYFQTLKHFCWTEMFADLPAVGDWYERCFSRPSYEEAIGAGLQPALIEQFGTAGEAIWPELQKVIV